MLAVGLKCIDYAKYAEAAGVETYTGGRSMGKSVSLDINPTIDASEFYCEDSLDESIRKFTGGTISIGVKSLDYTARADLYGHTRDAAAPEAQPPTPETLTAKKDDAANYVGVAFYAPVVEKGVESYRSMFFPKLIFSTPVTSFKTKDKVLAFISPTTVGTILPNIAGVWYTEALHSDEDDAIAWVKAKLSIT